MILKSLIEYLKTQPRGKVVKSGFKNGHSYFATYDYLAFEPASDVTIGEMLEEAERCVGVTFDGYNGGRYKMTDLTDVFLAKKGEPGDILSLTEIRAMCEESAFYGEVTAKDVEKVINAGIGEAIVKGYEFGQRLYTVTPWPLTVNLIDRAAGEFDRTEPSVMECLFVKVEEDSKPTQIVVVTEYGVVERIPADQIFTSRLVATQEALRLINEKVEDLERLRQWFSDLMVNEREKLPEAMSE